MRSVVVVLPASTCAMMPIFRMSERGVVRGIARFQVRPGLGVVQKARILAELVVLKRTNRVLSAAKWAPEWENVASRPDSGERPGFRPGGARQKGVRKDDRKYPGDAQIKLPVQFPLFA